MNTTHRTISQRYGNFPTAAVAGVGGFYSMQFWRQVGYMTAAI